MRWAVLLYLLLGVAGARRQPVAVSQIMHDDSELEGTGMKVFVAVTQVMEDDEVTQENVSEIMQQDPPELKGMKAFYINLDKSTERRSAMEEQLRKAGLTAQRFAAIDGKRVAAGEFNAKFLKPQGLKKETSERLLAEDPKKKILNRTVATYLSHYTVMVKAEEAMRKTPDNIVMVLEDDVAVPKDWRATVSAAIAYAPANWTMLKLSGWGQHRSEDLTPPVKDGFKGEYFRTRPPFWGEVLPEVVSVPFYGGIGAYVVRARNIPKILAALRAQPITDYDEMLLSDKLEVYEVVPHPIGLRADHAFSEIRPNGLMAVGHWLLRLVTAPFT